MATAAATGKTAKTVTNLEKLQKGNVIPAGHKLSPKEKLAIESLTPAEVKALASARGKVGAKLIEKHGPHGMFF